MEHQDEDNGSALISRSERDAMLAELYDELRAAAARLLSREAPFLTLQPTELVNEASLRVMRLERMSWQDRRHFFATSARILRQAMIDAIRKRRSAKRHAPTVLFETTASSRGLDAELLDDALVRLEAASPELAQLVELRIFVGLEIREIAELTDQSESTVKRRWRAARLWLADALADA